MAITWADVTAIAPALSGASAGTQSAILAIVALRVPATPWGDLQATGQAYLAAHLGTLAATNGAGAVTQEAVDRLSVSYASAAAIKGSLGLTSYGAEYERLLWLLPQSLGFVV